MTTQEEEFKETYRYGCTLKKFNKKISKYFSKVFGSPKINFNEHDEKVEGLSYSLPKENINVKVSVHPEYSIKGKKGSLDSRVEIAVTISDYNPIVRKLEEISDYRIIG